MDCYIIASTLEGGEGGMYLWYFIIVSFDIIIEDWDNNDWSEKGLEGIPSSLIRLQQKKNEEEGGETKMIRVLKLLEANWAWLVLAVE